MKTLLFLSLILTSFSTQIKHGITVTPDKLVYTQGEIMTFTVQAKNGYSIANTGACQNSILSPLYVLERKGIFLTYAMRQLCCGKSCSNRPYKEDQFTQTDTLMAGRWKALVPICGIGYVESEIFEVVEK